MSTGAENTTSLTGTGTSDGGLPKDPTDWEFVGQTMMVFGIAQVSIMIVSLIGDIMLQRHKKTSGFLRRVARFMFLSRFRLIFDYLEIPLSIASVIIFIVSSWAFNRTPAMRYTDLGFSVVFAYHYLATMAEDYDTLVEASISWSRVLNVLSMCSSLFTVFHPEQWLCFSFLRVIPARSSFHRILFKTEQTGADYMRQIVALVLDLVVMAFVFACCIFLCEQLGDFDWWQQESGNQISTLFRAFYFVFVTIATYVTVIATLHVFLS